MAIAVTATLPTCLARSTLSTFVAKSFPTDVNRVLPYVVMNLLNKTNGAVRGFLNALAVVASLGRVMT